VKVLTRLTWRILIDAQWTLILSILAMFSLGWLGLFRTLRLEREFRRAIELGDTQRLIRFARGSGATSMDFSFIAIEMSWWILPMILLPVLVWAIGRGSNAVAGELERGTMDLVLSRPVPRSTYLLSHVLAAVLGLLLLVMGLVAGHSVGVSALKIASPPPLVQLLRPALNLAALGFTIFGLTLLASTCDRVRWRPNLIGSGITLTSFVVLIVANLPGMEDWKRLEQVSIFKAYNPVELVTTGVNFQYNAGLLAGIGLISVTISLIIFGVRDLPAGS
jgi:ABC-2 type transport system permease protein